MWKKILVPIDGSKYGEKAIEIAADLAKPFKSKITLLLVNVPMSHIYADEGFLVPDYTDDLEKQGAKLLARSLKIAESNGLKAETLMVTGNAAEQIANVANREKYDLIIIGSRGLSRAKAFLLGSVSDKVIRYSKCPVLVVKLQSSS